MFRIGLVMAAAVVVLFTWRNILFYFIFYQMVEATPYSNPLPNPRLTNLETGAVGNSFFIGEMFLVCVRGGGGKGGSK